MNEDVIFYNQMVHDYRIEMLNRITRTIHKYSNDDLLLVNQLRRVFYSYIDYLEGIILKGCKKRIDTSPYLSNINRQLADYFSRDEQKSLISLVFNMVVDTNSMTVEMLSLVTDINEKLYFYGKSYQELRLEGFTNDDITSIMIKNSPFDTEMMLYLNHTIPLHKKLIIEDQLSDIYFLGVINDYIWERGFDIEKVVMNMKDMLSKSELDFYNVFCKKGEI